MSAASCKVKLTYFAIIIYNSGSTNHLNTEVINSVVEKATVRCKADATYLPFSTQRASVTAPVTKYIYIFVVLTLICYVATARYWIFMQNSFNAKLETY